MESEAENSRPSVFEFENISWNCQWCSSKWRKNSNCKYFQNIFCCQNVIQNLPPFISSFPTSAEVVKNIKGPRTLSKSGWLSQQDCCKQTVWTEISHYLSSISSLLLSTATLSSEHYDYLKPKINILSKSFRPFKNF